MLNHFYLSLDQKTFEAIRDSTFLCEQFAHTTEVEIKTDRDAWKAFYLTGQNTYIEFFGPEAGRSKLGLAFACDQKDEIKEFAQKLQTECKSIELKKYKSENKLIPWFFGLDLVDSNQDLSSWIMEYHPEILEFMFPDKDKITDISRKHYNAWTYKPQKLFKDISAMDIKLPYEQAEAFMQSLQKIGFKRHDNRLSSNGFSLSIDTECKSAGLHKIEFQLNRKMDSANYVIANTKLSIGNNLKAEWLFNGACF